MTATRKLSFALVGLALTGCGKLADDLFCEPGGCGLSAADWARVASLANPSDPPPDLSNEWRDNRAAIALGKQFFFDPAFSGNATQMDAIRRDSPAARATKGQPIGIACVTCHDLEHGGADTSSSPGHVSVGAGWTDVNALSVLNSAYRQVVFWNGRADSLWALNVVVAESWDDVNGNRLKTAHEIATRYAREYELAFGPLDVAAIAGLPADGRPGNDTKTCDKDNPATTEPFNDAFDCLDDRARDMVTRILVNWAKAIAAYEYQLVSRNSSFDKFVREGRDSTQISTAAKRGARLFVGKGACVDCHSGPQLTDELFHDIGVPQTGTAVPRTTDCPQGGGVCDCSETTTNICPPFGAWDGLRRLQGTKFTPPRPNNWLRTGKWSGDVDDASRQPYVNRPDLPDFDRLKGAWRTPSLRNVALTAPYMHDGRYASLKEVIWHYNNGGATAGPAQVGIVAPQIKPLLLTESEQDDLVAFLETLTGEPLPAEIAQPPALPGPSGSPPGSGTGGMGGSAAGGASGTAATSGGTAGMVTGAGGMGGGGGPPPVACSSTPPPSAAIADFSETQAGNPIVVGKPPALTGRTFSYTVSAVAPNPPPARLSIGAGNNATPALIIDAPPISGVPPGSWFVFGLTFDSCVDASVYTAVQFNMSGFSSSCPPLFGVMSKEDVNSAEDPRGTCPAPSCMPLVMPISGPGMVLAPISVRDPTSIVGLQWRLPVPCGGRLAIDDIAFVAR